MHWVYQWAGNWPLLDSIRQRDAAYEKEFRRLCGDVPRRELFLFRGETETVYHAQEEYDRLDRFLLRRFDRDPGFLVRTVADYRTRVNADLIALRAVRRINVATLSRASLAKLFIKALEHHSYNPTIDIYDWYIERLFTPLLEKDLQQRLGARGTPDRISEYLHALVTPHEQSGIWKERQQFFNIIRWIRRKKEALRAAQREIACNEVCTRFKVLGKLFRAYMHAYVWMPVLVNNPPHTEETVWKEITDYCISGKPLIVEAKRLGDIYDPEAIHRSKRIMRDLHISGRTRHMILGLRRMAFLRTEDYVVMSESSYCLIPLYTEVARRIGLSYAELKHFLPEEILNLLRAGKRVPKKELQQRISLTCLFSVKGGNYLFTGEEARAVEKVVLTQLKERAKKGSVLQGTPIYHGVVRGKARVAHTPVEASRIRKGEILVVASASAGFVPFLRKATGIIAEFGGLTSHPAIISRELRIPTIVGVRGATVVLKNGDRVEVDAEKGIVRKI